MLGIYSKDGSWILTFDGDSVDPEQLTVQEFIERYGEDALPSRGYCVEEVIAPNNFISEHKTEDVVSYYESLERVCKMCGQFSRASSMFYNACFGDPHTDNHVLFMAHRRKVFNLEKAMKNAESRAKACIKNFSYWHQRVGFGALNEDDQNHCINVLCDKFVRSGMYYRVRDNVKKQRLVPFRELIGDVTTALEKRHLIED